MKTIEKTLWEILVPTAIDDHPVKIQYHKIWDDKVRAISKGLTILKPAKGQWIDPSGKLYAEGMIPVRIACSEDDIEEIMKITADHYNQIEIMAYRISRCVKFYKHDEDYLGLGFMAAEKNRTVEEMV